MDIYTKIDEALKRFSRRNAPKTVSNRSDLKLLETVAESFLSLNCLTGKNKLGNELWNISQKTKQEKAKILSLLRGIKNVISGYKIKSELVKDSLNSGKTIIFTAGQNYTAYSRLNNFFVGAKKFVNIIDPYLDPSTFQTLRHIPVKTKIRLLTNPNGFYNGSKTDYNKFKKEYTIEARSSEIIHDRFFIIDGAGYFSGSSLHGAGNKLSAITCLKDDEVGILQSEFNKIWNMSKKIQ